MTDIENICESIEKQADLQVITANASIARELKTRLLNRSNQNRGYLARISDIDTWTENRANKCLVKSPLRIANYQQMLQLWEQVIEQDSQDFPDLQASILAPRAHRAWLHMLRWQVDRAELGELEEYNDLKLGSWCKTFENRLETLGLSQTDLVLTQNPVSDGAQIAALLYIGRGDSLTPLHQNYFDAAFKQVQQESWRNKDSASNKSFQAQFANQELELQAAANWAESIAAGTNKGSKVAIICTDSSVEASAVRRLSSYLSPALSASTELRISFPRRASDSGILDSALRLLELNRDRLTRADCRAVIRSPFWGNYPADIEQRSLWETELCCLEQKYLQPRDLLNTARTTATKLGLDRQDTLVQRLTDAQKYGVQDDSQHSLQYWAEQFSQQLSALGWPGQRPMQTGQSNLVELWNDLLTELVSLGAIEDKTSCAGALRLLRRLVQAARTRADKPAVGINMLNTIESAVGFEHIWLLGADSDHWPSMVRPDPLIPIQLQLQQSMPRCGPEQERDFCLNLFEQLRGNSKQLVFSIAQNDTDSVVEFSPLLASHPTLNPDAYAPKQSSAEDKNEDNDKHWQWIDCSSGPALEINDEITKGGSNLFNLMAASPFNAFATLRLNANPLPEAYLGIGPHHRGNILHGCLDQIWANLENSETLAKTSERDLRSLVEKITNEELLAWQSKNFNLDLSYFEQLKHSFCAVLIQWLNFERSRPAFVVEAREQKLHTKVGDLNLRLRIDRIDQLEEGSKLLIDYKSGASASDRDLLSSPPAAAQLPLYAISLDQALAGLAFAIVVSGNTVLKGISSDSGIRSLKPIEDWSAQMDQWKQDLTALAVAYADGDSRVFETQSNFARRDELVGLHRMPEYQDLEDWKEAHDSL